MVTADSIYAIADGRKVTLSLPAKLMNGSMMVPSSFITDAIGSQISWSPKNRELTVNIPNLPDVDKNSTSPIVKLNTYSISATARNCECCLICCRRQNGYKMVVNRCKQHYD